MRVLIVYRHFWPDTPPYASMLRTIAGDLASVGHEVTVWTEMPGYKLSAARDDVPRDEVVDGARVRRLSRLPLWHRLGIVRTLAKLAFPVRVVWLALMVRLGGHRFDLLLTATMPPVINGAAGAMACRLIGARLVYHFQDIYPELGATSGLWRDGGLLYRLLMWIDRRTCGRMARGVVLSEDMARTLTDRGVAHGKISIINNFMLDTFDDPGAAPADRGAGFKVIFAGNLGRFQGLEAVVDAAAHLDDLPDVEIVLMGEGKARAALEAQAAGKPNIRFLPHMPFEEAKSVIASADAGVVSLKPGIHRMAYPSKTLTYLGLGLPVVAVIEPDSELAGMIRDEDLGAVAGGRDAAAIAKAIRALYQRRGDLPAMRSRAQAVYETRFSRSAALAKWRDLVEGEGARDGA